MIAMNKSLHMFMPCHASYFIKPLFMTCCCMLMVRTIYGCYAHEPNLNVDQVPLNRALFVHPQLLVWAGLDAVYRWASLTRMHQSGEATRGSHPDQVAAVVLTTSMFWAHPHLGQVLCHAMVGAMRW